MRPVWMLLLWVWVLAGQESARPTFEVLSVKHVGDAESIVARQGNTTYSNQEMVRFVGGSMSCKTTLRSILRAAYQLKDFQIQGPDWIDREVYEIGARMPDGTPRNTARKMLQSALADRMGLRVRIEQKEFPVYLLVTIPGSKKPEKILTDVPSFSYQMGMGSMEAVPGMTMSSLAGMLSDSAGRPVLDETRLEGVYKVKLEWTDTQSDASVAHLGPDRGMISALPRIGLKLEPGKRMLDNLVVESVSREPTEN